MHPEDHRAVRLRSPPARGAWIEIIGQKLVEAAMAASPPARGAWIEIRPAADSLRTYVVAPREGGVD